MSEVRISSLDLLKPEFADRFAELVARTTAEKMGMIVWETGRSPSRQNQLYSRGREDPGSADFGRTVTDARAYGSFHQFGLAGDMIFRVNGAPSWDEPEPGAWAHYQQLASIVGLDPVRNRAGHIKEWPHVQARHVRVDLLEVGPPDTVSWIKWLQAKAIR